MKSIARAVVIAISVSMLLSLSACAPKVGSDKWCANLKAKPKGEWTVNEAGEYAKYCIFK